MSGTDWQEQIAHLHGTVMRRYAGIEPGSEEELRFDVMALAGEVGELANLVKKSWRGDFPLAARRAELTEELADIRLCLELVARNLGIDLDAACRAKIPALLARCPEAAGGMPTDQ